MNYTVKDYTGLLGMHGFSDNLLKNHFTLYQGYVHNTNSIVKTLDQMIPEGLDKTNEFSALKRRMAFEYDGMRLHELYFDNLGGNGLINNTGLLVNLLTENFGSYEAWEEDFRATASLRGIGWAVLYQDESTGLLNNYWLDEHHIGHPIDRNALLVLDAWEHAYMTDYGLKRIEYINAFFKNIDWTVVETRARG